MCAVGGGGEASDTPHFLLLLAQQGASEGDKPREEPSGSTGAALADLNLTEMRCLRGRTA